MSYQSDFGGLGTFGGFGYHSLGADYRIGASAPAVRSLQEELQRLGFLAAGADRSGADGYWGPRTATALAAAARYVDYAGSPFTPANADVAQPPPASVTVPDDLITRLRSAAPAPVGTPGAVTGAPVDSSAPVEPAPEGQRVLTTPTESGSRAGWVPAAVIGGGVLLAGAFIAWRMKPKKRKTAGAVMANRRRRRRRRRV